jgi:hypothetical protein
MGIMLATLVNYHEVVQKPLNHTRKGGGVGARSSPAVFAGGMVFGQIIPATAGR